jgi:hypothetical protein
VSSLDKDGNEIPDGFRKRKKRTKADMRRLIKEGVVADPAVGVPERVRTDNEYVIDVPTATASGKVANNGD